MLDTDFAYAAGYIDGDGCFSVGKFSAENRIRYRCQLIINSTSLPNLHWFQTRFGGNIIATKKPDETHKSLHRYVIRGKDLDILTKIKPFLNEKLEECRTLQEFRITTSKEEKESLILDMLEYKNSGIVEIGDDFLLDSYKNLIEPSIEDFAYLAGFIDAECCLNIQKNIHKNRSNPTYKIQLQCNNTKFTCFKWLSERFGGQFYFIDRSKYGSNYRNQIAWRISAAALYPILERIYPFLNHKKPVCEELIKFYNTTLQRRKAPSPNSPKFVDYYRPIFEEREAIFHKIQFLNKKGVNI